MSARRMYQCTLNTDNGLMYDVRFTSESEARRAWAVKQFGDLDYCSLVPTARLAVTAAAGVVTSTAPALAAGNAACAGGSGSTPQTVAAAAGGAEPVTTNACTAVPMVITPAKPDVKRCAENAPTDTPAAKR